MPRTLTYVSEREATACGAIAVDMDQPRFAAFHGAVAVRDQPCVGNLWHADTAVPIKAGRARILRKEPVGVRAPGGLAPR